MILSAYSAIRSTHSWKEVYVLYKVLSASSCA